METAILLWRIVGPGADALLDPGSGSLTIRRQPSFQLITTIYVRNFRRYPILSTRMKSYPLNHRECPGGGPGGLPGGGGVLGGVPRGGLGGGPGPGGGVRGTGELRRGGPGLLKGRAPGFGGQRDQPTHAHGGG
eukprot:scaffold9276_cov112-Isochrysis_galbana.AAC.2